MKQIVNKIRQYFQGEDRYITLEQLNQRITVLNELKKLQELMTKN